MDEEFKLFSAKNFVTKSRLIGLLGIGIVTFAYSIYYLSIIWTSKGSLTSISGTLENVDTYYFTVTDRHGERRRLN